MFLVVGAVGGATRVTTGKQGVGAVVGALLLTKFCAVVAKITAFGSKITVFVGSLAVATGELLTNSLTQTLSSALVEAPSCETVSRNSD